MVLKKIFLPSIWKFFTRGPSRRRTPTITSGMLLFFFCAIYAMVFVVLCVMSIGTLWPYPNLFPTEVRWTAWQQFVMSPAPLLNSLSLAFASTLAALGLAIFWLETVPEKLDAALLVFAIMAIALPSLLIADGQYLAFLRFGLNGTWLGVFLAHLTPVFAYVFIVLKGPYRAFDPRYRAVSLGLNADPLPLLVGGKAGHDEAGLGRRGGSGHRRQHCAICAHPAYCLGAPDNAAH